MWFWYLFAGFTVGAFVDHFLLQPKKEDCSEEDNTQMIQNLIDKVDGIIEDIKKTV